jgi:hypothetical protein
VLVAVLAAVTLGACGEKSSGLRAPQAGATVPGGGAAPPGAGDGGGAANPSTTVKSTPECAAMYQFQLAGLTATNVPPDKQADYLATADKAAAQLKTLAPTISADVDATLTTLKASLKGPVSEADKAANEQVAARLNSWWTTNCL